MKNRHQDILGGGTIRSHRTTVRQTSETGCGWEIAGGESEGGGELERSRRVGEKYRRTAGEEARRIELHLDKLQVGQRSHVEVGDVLRRGDAVQLVVAAADRLRLRAICAAEGGGAIEAAEMGGRAKL